MIIGDIVRVREPFNMAFPATYQIDDIKEDGTVVICGDRDFAPEWVELVEVE